MTCPTCSDIEIVLKDIARQITTSTDYIGQLIYRVNRAKDGLQILKDVERQDQCKHVWRETDYKGMKNKWLCLNCGKIKSK